MLGAGAAEIERLREPSYCHGYSDRMQLELMKKEIRPVGPVGVAAQGGASAILKTDPLKQMKISQGGSRLSVITQEERRLHSLREKCSLDKNKGFRATGKEISTPRPSLHLELPEALSP